MDSLKIIISIIIYSVYLFECSTPQGQTIETIFWNIYKLGNNICKPIKKNIKTFFNNLKTDTFAINEYNRLKCVKLF